MTKYLYRFASTLSALTLVVALAAAGARSTLIYHQPKVPAGLDKFRK